MKMTSGMIKRLVVPLAVALAVAAVVLGAASCVSPAPSAPPAAPEAASELPETASELPEAAPEAQPPAAPGGLTAQPGDRSIDLDWDDPHDATIVSYEVRLRARRDADWRSWKVVAGSTRATTSHALPGLTPGVPYRIQVRARNAAGVSPPSETSATPLPLAPAAPAGLTAQPGDGSIDLDWDDPHDAGIVFYEVRLRAPRDADWRDWKIAAGSTHTTTSHTLPGLTAGIAYRIQVRARNAAGPGAPGETSATPLPPLPPPPAAPSGLTALPGDRSISLDWNDPGDPAIVSYEFRIRPAQDADWPDWNAIAGSSHATTGFTLLRGLANGLLYQIQIRARNAAGPGAPGETSATPLPPPPAAPSGLTALPGDRSISLDWNDPGDPGIASYEFRIRPAQDADWPDWKPIAGSSHDTTGYTLLRGLANGVLYQIQVRARNAAGAGAPGEISATPRPPAPRGAPPEAPTGLTARPGDLSISLGWDDPGDAGIASYEFRLRAPRDADWRRWRAIDGSTHATTGHLLPGLTNGVLYQIQLRARNAAGPSEPSQTSATPNRSTSHTK